MKLFLFSLLALAPAWADPLTQEERNRAMSDLHATRKQFLDSVAGLSQAQWNFKPDDKVWSIAECAEHITISEDTIFQLVSGKILKTSATPDKKDEVKGKDERVLTEIRDRTQKFQAPEFLRPTQRWPSQDALVAHFKQSRDGTIAYVQTTQDDLRSHFLEHPVMKLLDAYQWILLISAHSSRHTAQLNEVKSSPNFPK